MALATGVRKRKGVKEKVSERKGVRDNFIGVRCEAETVPDTFSERRNRSRYCSITTVKGVTMRLSYAIGLVALFIVTAKGWSAEGEMTPSAVFQTASRSIVVVETFDAKGQAVAQGSGVVVAPGVVVTNCHVFKDATVAQVRYQKHRLEATLRDSDAARDLCTLWAGALTAPPAQLGSASIAQIGDRVYAIGAPQGLELTLSDGLISSLRPLDGGNILQVTAPISHGSSGGGLFDDHARLIGITTMYLSDSQQLNFAVPVEWINELPMHTSVQAAAAPITVTSVDLGNAVGIDNRVVAPMINFATIDTIHASVASDGGIAGNLAVKLTYGPDKQPVDSQELPVAAGPHVTDFSFSKPDGWPLGGYKLEVMLNGNIANELDYCVVDANTSCRRVVGQVYSYVEDGIRRYSSEPPVMHAGGVKTINYSYLESSELADTRWKTIYSDNEQTSRFDTNTLKNEDGKVRVWREKTYSKPVKLGVYPGIAKVMSLDVYYCALHKMSFTSIIFYSSNGKVVASEKTSEYSNVSDIVPGSIGEVLWTAACQ